MSDVPQIAPLEPGREAVCEYCQEHPATKRVLAGDCSWVACDACAALVQRGVGDAHYHYCTCWYCTGHPGPHGFGRGTANETVDCPACDGTGRVYAGADDDTPVECGFCEGTGAIDHYEAVEYERRHGG